MEQIASNVRQQMVVLERGLIQQPVRDRKPLCVPKTLSVLMA
jgi:hypothetical protein